MHIDDSALDATIGRLSGQPLLRMEARDALELVVGTMPALFGVDGAGVLLLDDQQALRHVVSTDRAAEILEALQETTGRGPCVTSLMDDTVVEVDDVESDPRWPDLAPVLVENGIRGTLGAPIHVAGTPVGSLNVYHRDARGWDPSDVEALLAYDRVVERLLSSAMFASHSERLIGQLEGALESRIVIDRAVGMLMALLDLDAAGAFERIRRSARSTRRPVREVAAEVLSRRQLL